MLNAVTSACTHQANQNQPEATHREIKLSWTCRFTIALIYEAVSLPIFPVHNFISLLVVKLTSNHRQCYPGTLGETRSPHFQRCCQWLSLELGPKISSDSDSSKTYWPKRNRLYPYLTRVPDDAHHSGRSLIFPRNKTPLLPRSLRRNRKHKTRRFRTPIFKGKSCSSWWIKSPCLLSLRFGKRRLQSETSVPGKPPKFSEAP